MVTCNLEQHRLMYKYDAIIGYVFIFLHIFCLVKQNKRRRRKKKLHACLWSIRVKGCKKIINTRLLRC